MSATSTTRKRRLRRTKAQLLDELEALERRMATDIAERERAEEELAAKEQQLRVALDNAPGGMMLGDRDLKYVLHNAQYSALYEFPEGLVEAGGDFYDELRFQAERGDFGPGDRDELIAQVAATYQRGDALSYERVIAGSGRTLQISLAPTPEGGTVTIVTDITERKRAEAELAESRELLQALADNLPEFITLKDLKGRFLFVNKTFEAWICRTRDDVIGKTTSDIYATVQEAEISGLERQAIDDRQVLTQEAELSHPDGVTRAVIRTKFPVISSQGKVLGVGTVLHDITERKQAEEALRESERRLIEILDLSPVAVSIVGAGNERLYGNSRLAAMFGLERDAMVGGERVSVFAREDTARLYELYEKDGAVLDFDIEGRRADGSSFWATRTVAPIEFDGLPATIHWAYDITERKRAEEVLAEKEAQLRLALDNMPGGMVLADRKGKFVSFNAQYGELHDYPDGLLKIGGTVADTVRFQAQRGDYGPGNIDELVEAVSAPYEQGKTVNYERTLATGRTLHFNVAPTPEGGYVTIVTDITERKRAEQELAEKEALLRLALDNMPGGLAVNDSDFNYVVVNDWIRDYLGVPDGLMEAGQPMEGLLRYLASQGAYGPGEIDNLVKERYELLKNPENTVSELAMPDGRTLQLRRQKLEDGGNAVIFSDITEIRQAEKALSDQLKFVEALVETIPNPIFVKDAETRYKILNQAYLQAFGIEREDVIGKTVLEAEIMPMEQRDSLQKRAEELLADGGMHHQETSRLFADGKVHDILYWQSAIELDDGNIGGLVGVLVDISEQKALERALAKSQEQYHALVDNLQVALSSMSDGIFIIDGELNYVAFNQKYVDLLGFPEGLVREGGTIAEVTEYAARRGDYGSQFEGGIDEIVAGRLKQLASDSEYVIENVTPTGRIVEYRGSPIKGGGYVSIMHDITERRKAEDALEEAHETIKVQRDRMEDELNVGREIQMSMIPLTFPPFPDHDEFTIFAALEPAREVGGDFYDFFFVDDDRLCLCIGDVSGKGVPSALFMAVTKTLIKSRAMDDTSTAGILSHVNAELAADNKASMFVTIFLAILNFKTGELVYTNAGHNPPYLRREDGTLQRLDTRHGPVVGALPGLAYRQDSTTVGAGDMLFMYTDGVTEERNGEGELYSEQRLATLLGSQGMASVESAVQGTVAAVREFRGTGIQEDDVTVLAVQFQGSSMADPDDVFRVTARNDLSEIAMVVGKFQEFASKRGLPLELGRRISVIFDDLLNNVISYAFPDGEGHEIEIRTELADNRLTVTISDDGIPFNPLSAGTPDTSLSLERRAIGGLGIHLVRNLVDEVTYQRRIGRNVLTLVKRIDANDGTF